MAAFKITLTVNNHSDMVNPLIMQYTAYFNEYNKRMQNVQNFICNFQARKPSREDIKRIIPIAAQVYLLSNKMTNLVKYSKLFSDFDILSKIKISQPRFNPLQFNILGKANHIIGLINQHAYTSELKQFYTNAGKNFVNDQYQNFFSSYADFLQQNLELLENMIFNFDFSVGIPFVAQALIKRLHEQPASDVQQDSTEQQTSLGQQLIRPIPRLPGRPPVVLPEVDLEDENTEKQADELDTNYIPLHVENVLASPTKGATVKLHKIPNNFWVIGGVAKVIGETDELSSKGTKKLIVRLSNGRKVSIPVSMIEKHFDDILVRDGSPVEVFVPREDPKARYLTDAVVRMGGKVSPVSDKDSLTVVTPTIPNHSGLKLISSRWLTECVRQGKYIEPSEHTIEPLENTFENAPNKRVRVN